MADSENSRTLPKISCANAFPNETFVDNLPSVINRRNLLPLAARILPMLLNDLPSRTIAGPVHARSCGRTGTTCISSGLPPSGNAGNSRRDCWKRPAVVLLW